MSGFVWGARKGTKAILKDIGMSPRDAAIAGFVVGGAVSLLTHEHWGHIPDADDLADLADCSEPDDCSGYSNTDNDPFCDRKVSLTGECDHSWKKHMA